MGNTINMAAYARLLSGLDPMLHQAEISAEPGDNYPPYNIEKIGDDRYRVALAVAGFADSELSVTVEANQLIVTGNKVRADNRAILYQGLAHRPFTRRFSLADHMVVKDAGLAQGLLTIELERQEPGAVKPKRVAIDSLTPALRENTRAAA